MSSDGMSGRVRHSALTRSMPRRARSPSATISGPISVKAPRISEPSSSNGRSSQIGSSRSGCQVPTMTTSAVRSGRSESRSSDAVPESRPRAISAAPTDRVASAGVAPAVAQAPSTRLAWASRPSKVASAEPRSSASPMTWVAERTTRLMVPPTSPRAAFTRSRIGPSRVATSPSRIDADTTMDDSVGGASRTAACSPPAATASPYRVVAAARVTAHSTSSQATTTTDRSARARWSTNLASALGRSTRLPSVRFEAYTSGPPRRFPVSLPGRSSKTKMRRFLGPALPRTTRLGSTGWNQDRARSSVKP